MSLVNLTVSDDGVATVSLNRPEKLNAFSRALCDEYLGHLDALESEIKVGKVRVVVIDTTTDKAFSAGADLKEREAMNEAAIDQQLKVQREMMDRTEALAVPTIAVLRGIAFGGGLELALACDLRIASESAQMGLTELKLAIIPGSGGTQRLTRLVGLSKARELIMLSKCLDALTAKAYGLVNDISADPSATLKEYLSAILSSGPLAQTAAKRAINGGLALPLKEALDLERKCYDVVLKSQDREEGLRAFLAKRAPQYRGV